MMPMAPTKAMTPCNSPGPDAAMDWRAWPDGLDGDAGVTRC